MTSSYQIHVAHDMFKFSCAHMTVFPDGRKERLHGHNYYVSVTLSLGAVGFDKLVEFASVKAAIAELCLKWREHTLIAAANPHYELVSQDDDEIEFRLCDKRYVLPREDVLVLPVDNITVEALSAHFTELLVDALGPVLRPDVVHAIEVRVTESAKQGASCHRRLGS